MEVDNHNAEVLHDGLAEKFRFNLADLSFILPYILCRGTLSSHTCCC